MGVWECPNFGPGVPKKRQNDPKWKKGRPKRCKLTKIWLSVGSKWLGCMECSNKDLLSPFNAIIGIEMQRESKGCQDYWIHFSSWQSLSGHFNNFCINSLQKRCPHSWVLLLVLSQDLLSQHLILIQPFWITWVLKVRFRPFWSFFGVHGQKFGTTPHSQLKLNLNLDVQ